MRLIRGLSRWQDEQPSVVTIGNFDGVHLGHQAMLEKARVRASDEGLLCTVISFEPLPHEYFAKDQAPARLQGLRDRVLSIAATGMDRLLLLDFSAEQAAQSAEEFVHKILIDAVHAKHIIIGDDFRFGHKRAGDRALLERIGAQAGFTVTEHATVSDQESRISSSRIRQALLDGKLDEAESLLGRPYRISGRVIHGEKVGRQLGFPTANVALGPHRPPLRGVFAVTAHDANTAQSWPAVANLGERPTVGGRKLLLEVHLLDVNEALYGKQLAINFHEFIRGEVRFDSLDELKAQIARDADVARELLS